MSATRPDATGFFTRCWQHRHFYGFISPFFVLFAIFGLYPLVFSFVLSFAEWDGFLRIVWVGFDNLRQVAVDDAFWDSLWNTLVLGVLYVPPMLIGAFVFAVMLNLAWLKMRGFFRAAFFLPVITPMVVVALVFGLLYDVDQGLLNHVVKRVGAVLPWIELRPIPWLMSEAWSKPSIAILLVWRWTGYNMVLMLAGLQGISKEYYESAWIDGAGAWRRMWHITLPLMRPVFVFCSIMSLIGTVYMFDEMFVMTQGGPGRSSTNFGLYLFNTSFDDFKLGYASCLAYCVSIVVFALSLLILRFRKDEGN